MALRVLTLIRNGQELPLTHIGAGYAEFPEVPREAQATIWLPLRGRPIVRLPHWMTGGEAWLKNCLGSRCRPEWNADLGGWAIARKHLIPLALALGAVLRGRPFALVQDYSTTQRCDERCWSADPSGDCICSCKRKMHGRHRPGTPPPGWLFVGETVAITSPGRSRTVAIMADDGL